MSWTPWCIDLKYMHSLTCGESLLCLCLVQVICDVWLHKEVLDGNNAQEVVENCSKNSS